MMNIDDILKLKAATAYILKKKGEADTLFVLKILYFANRDHLAKYGMPLVKDTFCALDYGPVASVLYDAIKIARNMGHSYFDRNAEIVASAITPVFDYVLRANEEPDMDELSKSDIACLDACIEKYKDYNFGQLSEESHDSAWEKARRRSVNSEMNLIEIAEAGGANKEMQEYIMESLSVDEVLN